MKKFLFRLETLLSVRHKREKNMQRDFESARQKLEQIQEQEKTLTNQINLLQAEIHAGRLEGKLKFQETYFQILNHLYTTLTQVQNALLAHERQLEEQQGRLKQAVLERKVIEKIKEKHYAGWRMRESLSEGALLDEIALKKPIDFK